MSSLLVRLKSYDPRRGVVLRRFTYKGIKFQEERGWYRVEPEIAAYLRGVRQSAGDDSSPLAFDVCTLEEAQRLDKESEAGGRRKATEAVSQEEAQTSRQTEPRRGAKSK